MIERLSFFTVFVLALNAASTHFVVAQQNVTITNIVFSGAIGGSSYKNIKVTGFGLPAWNVRSTIWDTLHGIHSGPVSAGVTGGIYVNIIPYGGPGDYPTGPYTAGSVLEGNGNPPGQNVASQEFLVVATVGGKVISIPGAGGAGGGGGE